MVLGKPNDREHLALPGKAHESSSMSRALTRVDLAARGALPRARWLRTERSAPRAAPSTPGGKVASSKPGSLELVDFSPVGACKGFVAVARRAQPKLPRFGLILKETAL